MNKCEHNNITILEAIMWLVVNISIISVITLIFGVFKPSLVLVASFLALFIGLFATRKTVNIKINRKLFLLLLMLLSVTLFFRIDSEQYIMGGQDQGVYVNMSKYFERYGQVFPVDEFRASLNDDLKAIYDKNNVRLETKEHIKVHGKKEGSFLPGVYVKALEKSEYVFQFYHLHPIFMAIFGDTFGEDKRQFSLLFFALLSVIFVYFIIFKITSNTFYSFMGGLLLAVSPLHAYFTKFPVTEVMALCFSLAGFYFLLVYYKIFFDSQKKVNRYLVLSALIFGAMFFIRIHGFMYIPFFYTLFLLTIVSNTLIRKELLIYFLGIFTLLGLSVWYGLVYSYPYASYIYSISFSQALGTNWNQIILALILLMIIFPLVLSKLASLRRVVEKFKEYSLKYFYIIFLIVLVLGIYKIYQLGFTDNYSGHPWLDSRWNIAGAALKSFLHSSLIVLVEHVSLILFVVFLIGLKFYDKKNNYLNTLVLFIFSFWVYALLLQWTVPYQYYYARYLLSELIPYFLLFTILFMSTMKQQKLAIGLLVISIVYFIGLTSFQLKGTESKGAYYSLNKIAQEVSRGDLLLVSDTSLFSGYPMEIKTTLKYYYDLNVFSYRNEGMENILNKFAEDYKSNIYVLTSTVIAHKFFIEVKNIAVNIETTNNTKHHSVIVKYFKENKHYILYRLDKNAFIKPLMLKKGIVYQSNGIAGTKENFQDRTWTKSSSLIYDLDFLIGKRRILELVTYGWNPNRAKLDMLNLKLKINGKDLNFIKYIDKSYYFKIPKDLEKIQKIEISSKTFNPKKMGINNDTRDLGIDLKEIKLLKELP